MASNQLPLSIKRLMNDFVNLQKQELQGVNARPDTNNLYKWDAVIFGPDSTPYENGTFHLTLQFPKEYPMLPPVVRFEPTIFHPNVYANGSVCLDILNKAWSATFTVSTILLSVQALLITPNPNSPANAEAATLFQSNRAEYNKRVKKSVEASWMAETERKATQAANQNNQNNPGL